MKLAAGDARNRVVPASSIGSPKRPKGMRLSIIFTNHSCCIAPATRSVGTKPGATPVTAIRYFPHSVAS